MCVRSVWRCLIILTCLWAQKSIDFSSLCCSVETMSCNSCSGIQQCNTVMVLPSSSLEKLQYNLQHALNSCFACRQPKVPGLTALGTSAPIGPVKSLRGRATTCPMQLQL